MSTRNPMEASCPPDEIVGAFTISAILDPDTQTWSVYCKQWGGCELHDKNLTRCIAVLVAEIETHNQEILQGEPSWHKDPAKMAEAAYLGTDHETAQALKRKAALEAPQTKLERNLEILEAHSLRSAKWNAYRQGRKIP